MHDHRPFAYLWSRNFSALSQLQSDVVAPLKHVGRSVDVDDVAVDVAVAVAVAVFVVESIENVTLGLFSCFWVTFVNHIIVLGTNDHFIRPGTLENVVLGRGTVQVQ